MTELLNDLTLDQLFRQARTHSYWQDKPVSAELLHQLYELVKWAPTSANACPARFVFVQSESAKQRLLPAMAEGNLNKTRTAPVTVIVAFDSEFYEQLPKLYPHADARSWFAGNPTAIEATARRNSSLQGAYLILAARALGLDCGPMSGFDDDKLNAEFFPDGKWKANFLINLGYGVPEKLYPRNPRLDFDEACILL